MRWAFADDDNWLWKPTRKAQPRLVGLGIATATAAVQLEIKIAPEEKTRMENMILRLRGVKHSDIDKVRQGSIRLREMRFVPRAELIPMKGLRPEGPAKEEVQA